MPVRAVRVSELRPRPLRGRVSACARPWSSAAGCRVRAAAASSARSSAVSTSSASDGSLATEWRTPAAAGGARRAGGRLSGPKLGAIASGGARSAGRSCRSRGGRGRSRPRARPRLRAEQPGQLAGIEQRRVAGHEQHALESLGERVRARRSAAAGLCPASRSSRSSDRAGRCRRSRRLRGSEVTTAIASSPATRPSEHSVSLEHRLRESRAAGSRAAPARGGSCRCRSS